MTKKSASPEVQLPPYVSDVEQLLEHGNVPHVVRQKYIGYLGGDNTRPEHSVRQASFVLGKIYITSLQFPGEPAYEYGEQAMMGLAMGRTITDDPLPIKKAAEQFAMKYDQFDEASESYVRLFVSGIHKLRIRIEDNPRLRADIRKRLEHVYSLSKVGRPEWFE